MRSNFGMTKAVLFLVAVVGLLAGGADCAGWQPLEMEIPEPPNVSFGDPSVDNISQAPQPTFAKVTPPAKEATAVEVDALPRLATYLVILVLAFGAGTQCMGSVAGVSRPAFAVAFAAIGGMTLVGAVLVAHLVGVSPNLAGALAFVSALLATIAAVGGCVYSIRMSKVSGREGPA